MSDAVLPLPEHALRARQAAECDLLVVLFLSAGETTTTLTSRLIASSALFRACAMMVHKTASLLVHNGLVTLLSPPDPLCAKSFESLQALYVEAATTRRQLELCARADRRRVEAAGAAITAL